MCQTMFKLSTFLGHSFFTSPRLKAIFMTKWHNIGFTRDTIAGTCVKPYALYMERSLIVICGINLK